MERATSPEEAIPPREFHWYSRERSGVALSDANPAPGAGAVYRVRAAGMVAGPSQNSCWAAALAVRSLKESPVPFSLPPLPYPKDALEPHIDAATMEIHHGKHHNAYVTNANNALAGTPWADADPVKVIQSLGEIPDDKRAAVRNNAGGHVNHSMFWALMSPPGQGGGGAPSGPWPQPSRPPSARSMRSRPSSPTPPPNASAPAGPGWSSTRGPSRSVRPPTRTTR